MLEQVPVQMGEGALRWAKLVIPLVVHSASKVRLRAAAALETGMPLLLEKQMEVAGIIEPMMSTVSGPVRSTCGRASSCSTPAERKGKLFIYLFFFSTETDPRAAKAVSGQE